MRTIVKGLVTAAALGGVSIAAVQPAQARDHTGVAVAAGIIGLGVGAALASSSHHSGYYYDSGYTPYYGSGYGYDYYQPSYGMVYERGYDRRHWRDDRGWGHDRNWGHDRGEHRGWDRDRRW